MDERKTVDRGSGSVMPMLPLKQLASVVAAAVQSMLEFGTFSRLADMRRTSSTIPHRFVERLIRLGPLYVKVGQIFSTRPDVLPKEYISALQRLQERVPPTMFCDVEAIVREEFNNRRIADVFGSFDETPTASASVAQVHFAMSQRVARHSKCKRPRR